ncbi:MAG: hypothetical protein KJP04_10585, partial [Arenicella sp.]|nr:hypothetical protein [Arenicella sp.]
TYTPLIKDRNNAQAMINLDNALLQRVNDLRTALTTLDRLNAIGQFEGKLNLSKIGLVGRSFGGTTTLAGLLLEPRFTAGVAVVPLVLPDIRNHFPSEVVKPAGEESVLLSADKNISLHNLNKPTMLLSGAEDALIIGAGAGMAEAMGTQQPTTDTPLPALRQAYESSSQPAIWGLLKDSNHGSFGVSGPYWWPQYKTSTQKRFFPPHRTFKLVKAETAHEIQKHKVLQFFDVMIRGRQDARKALLKNEFRKQGLIYETRNFEGVTP